MEKSNRLEDKMDVDSRSNEGMTYIPSTMCQSDIPAQNGNVGYSSQRMETDCSSYKCLEFPLYICP